MQAAIEAAQPAGNVNRATELAHAIAYQAARSDIEIYCAGDPVTDSGPHWFDLDHVVYDGNDEQTVADVRRAADYLRLRGLLVSRSEAEPNIVRFLPEPGAATTPRARRPFDIAEANAATFGRPGFLPAGPSADALLDAPWPVRK